MPMIKIDWKRPDKHGSAADFLRDVIAAGWAKTRADAEKVARTKIPAESSYQAKIKKYIMKRCEQEHLHCVAWKNAAGMYSTGGVSDLTFLIGNGEVCIPMMVEVKRPVIGTDASDLQVQFIRQVNEAGGVAGVAVYEEDADKLITDVLNKLRRN